MVPKGEDESQELATSQDHMEALGDSVRIVLEEEWEQRLD
jgi:hypothetical protein